MLKRKGIILVFIFCIVFVIGGCQKQTDAKAADKLYSKVIEEHEKIVSYAYKNGNEALIKAALKQGDDLESLGDIDFSNMDKKTLKSTEKTLKILLKNSEKTLKQMEENEKQ